MGLSAMTTVAARRSIQQRGKSLFYRLWQFIIIALRAVTPISYFYVFTFIMSQASAISFSVMAAKATKTIALTAFSSWMLAETIWFPYYLFTVRRLQQRRAPYHASVDLQSRRTLAMKCWQSLELACKEGRTKEDLQEVISGWFLGARFEDIKKDNIRSWVAWAFLDEDIDQLAEDAIADVDALVNVIESRMDYTFPPGRNDDVKCIRITLDPVQAAHRPLIYYLVTMGVNKLAHHMLHRLGFRQRTLDPMDVTGHGTLKYLYRGPSEPVPPNALPIVFIHGIGIGLAAYLTLLSQLPRNVPIYLLEWPHVSMQLAEEVPTVPDTISYLSGMLNRDNHTRATFVAHSLGTVSVSWMLNSPLHRSKVGSVVLLDPVTFLLCDPAIAYNFLYRPPSSVLELLMNYFVSREMYIANSLSRHFHWSKNILFWEDLPTGKEYKNVVLLCEEDAIVPAKKVHRYLRAKMEEADTHDEEAKNTPNLEVLYYEHRHHGELLLRQSMLSKIVEKIQEACGSANPDPSTAFESTLQEERCNTSECVTCTSNASSPATSRKVRYARQPAKAMPTSPYRRKPAPAYTPYKPAWKLMEVKMACDEKPRLLIVPSAPGRGGNASKRPSV